MKFLLARKFLLSSICFTRILAFSSTVLHNSIRKMPNFSFIDAKTAQSIDDRLMNQQGFSIDQLMELAGLSVANAVHDFYTSKYGEENPSTNRRLLVFCGPGNNGGDGLVAARHLKHFGYLPSIVYPKQGKLPLFTNLVKQCIDLEIEILSQVPSVEEMNLVNMIVDGVFGFSFQGPIRAPYDSIIQSFSKTKTPVLSIDVPSGWDVNEGDVHSTGFNPDATISLTLPKNCMKTYTKIHYLGGRFVPPQLANEFGIIIPDYGYNPTQIIRLDLPSPSIIQSDKTNEAVIMFTSAPNIDEAKRIANHLVQGKLAACVNIIPQVVSVYEWDGKIDNSDEILLMIKTRKTLALSVTAAIQNIHSYQLPESIALNIESQGSSSAFVQWILDSTAGQKSSK